jgi:hypothetical protein
MGPHVYRVEGESRIRHMFRIAGYVILGVLGAAIFAVALGYFVMLLWNWLMPELFGIKTITFWQAAGIIILARLVFGGFKHPANHHYNYRKPPMMKEHFKNQPFNWKWKYYDEFWKKEGEERFREYIASQDNKKDESSGTTES